MIPVIVEQYVQRMLSPQTPRNERENCRFVLSQIRDVCEKAILKFDGKRF